MYITPDSGGECGVPYDTYFPMPTPATDKPWYSIEQGPVHFTIISTEHDWKPNSEQVSFGCPHSVFAKSGHVLFVIDIVKTPLFLEQYNWIKSDMASVDRTRTPWLIFTGYDNSELMKLIFW